MGRLHIIEVRTVTHTGGGPEKTILWGARWLSRRGWPIHLVYLHPPGDEGFAAIRQKAAELDVPLLEVEDRGPLDYHSLRTVWDILHRLDAAIWHGHDYKSDALGWLLRRSHRLKLVSTVHGWGVYGPRVKLYHFVHKLCLRGFDKVLCVSESLREECCRAGIPACICTVLENGVDCEHFAPAQSRHDVRRRLGLPIEAFVVGYVGRLSAEKDLPTLVRALSRLLQQGLCVHGLIVGDGPARGELLRLAGECQLEGRITFTGYAADPRDYYAAMDVFVLPSLREGLPNVLLEAMAMGLPVVTTAVGGIGRLVTPGQTGLIFPPENAEALANALANLAANPEGARSLGLAAREYVCANYSFDRRMERLEEIYDQLLRER